LGKKAPGLAVVCRLSISLFDDGSLADYEVMKLVRGHATLRLRHGRHTVQ
jgi:hypothetical protein